jgi:hypothetical protein
VYGMQRCSNLKGRVLSVSICTNGSVDMMSACVSSVMLLLRARVDENEGASTICKKDCSSGSQGMTDKNAEERARGSTKQAGAGMASSRIFFVCSISFCAQHTNVSCSINVVR